MLRAMLSKYYFICSFIVSLYLLLLAFFSGFIFINMPLHHSFINVLLKISIINVLSIKNQISFSCFVIYSILHQKAIEKHQVFFQYSKMW